MKVTMRHELDSDFDAKFDKIMKELAKELYCLWAQSLIVTGLLIFGCGLGVGFIIGKIVT
jgi:hypothetical protein